MLSQLQFKVECFSQEEDKLVLSDKLI
jgi:hypothetical protein